MALMSRPAKGNTLFYRLAFKRLKHIFVQDWTPLETSSDSGPSKCVKLDSVKLGIKRSMISRDSYKVVKDLQIGGFETYLVGGCVRDLLLNKVPKDFDVITTAKLDTVKQKFRRAVIVGKRFPVCRVIFKNSVVEVTSFGKVDKSSRKRKDSVSQMPAGCNNNKHDLTRWNDCMRRDFTVNSLLYDPFENKVFDCIDAMKDLKSMKLRAIKQATLSFKEDQARILRGIRLAARLGLSFSKETEAAIHDLSPYVAELSMSRLFMEINYMLSFGAAEASILMLKKFNVLEILLPFQAAYLSERLDSQIDPHCLLLMKLLFNLDQLISCDRPCDGSLWVALLSFHMAVFIDPQPAEVVLTFASLLYNGEWDKSIMFARQHAPQARIYNREIYVDSITLSDDEIAERVAMLAEQAKNSVRILTSKDCLKEAMARFPESPSSGFILISRNMGRKAEETFNVLVDIRRANTGNLCMGIDYKKLGEGNIADMKFVLGQIIIDTLNSNATGNRDRTKFKKIDENDGPEQLLEVLGQMQDATTEPRKVEAKLKAVNKQNSSSNNKLMPKYAPKARTRKDVNILTEVTLSRDNVHEGPEQLLEVLGKMTQTDPRKDEPKPTTDEKQSSPSNNKLLLKYSTKAKIIRDDGIESEVTLSSIMNPDNHKHNHRLGSHKVEKDKYVKSGIGEKVPSLSSLFK